MGEEDRDEAGLRVRSRLRGTIAPAIVVCALAVATCLSVAPAASADRSFSARFSASERGQVTTAGNSLLTCASSGSCSSTLRGSGSRTNANFTMRYVDADGSSSTFNSSQASLALPSGSTVLFAGLYWGGDTSAGTNGSAAPAPSSRSTVRFATPTAGYRTVTASVTDTDATQTTRFQGFADVTSDVAAAGNGTYTVGNVQSGTGANRWGGWGLVVAYRLASDPVRRLVVYDGFLALRPGIRPSADITLSGFLTPASGTVAGRLSMLAWEGDRAITGDTATLASRTLSDAANPPTDLFNSSISRAGTAVTTRTPSTVNTLGVDADDLTIDGVLPNGASSATLALSTGQDTYLPGALALAVTDSAPASTAGPAISGTARDGQTLTASAGTWAGSTPIAYAYQWQRCNSVGGACANVSGATAATYALGPADVGSTMRVVVTATNAAGPTAAPSAVSSQVAALAPANAAAPTISGTTRDGESLTVANGTWTGTPPLAYAYQWQRCDAAGASCAAISGATAATYRLTSADAGRTIRAVVTATNAAGSASATTASTAAIAAAPPANATAPTISGTARDGATLTGAPGTWTGTTPITYAYQWRRCDVSGASCADIAGATSATYTQGAADAGATLRLVVTATNSAGSATATSAPSDRVAAAPPANATAPAISGTARDGQTLSISSDGTWTGTAPLSYGYQWQRCSGAGAGCSDIAGATGSTYTLTPSEVGNTVRARVTATNTAGTATAASAVSASVTAAPPVNTAVPTVAGIAREGETLTAQPGSWTGTPPITFAYEWQRCDGAGANCAAIAGATASTYTATAADTGGRVRVSVTATNAAGSASAQSATASVNPAAPVSTELPAVTGTPRDGETLTADEGTWSGSRPLTYAYQWLRCDTSGASCAEIAGATSRTYAARAADVNGRLRVSVTATNRAGTATATSGPGAAVAARAPAATAGPAIAGSARDGETLTVTSGTWTGTEPIAYDHQWQRCDAAGAGCVPIAGATGTAYTAGPEDVGSTLRVAVTASNAGGTQSATSAATDPVDAAPPVNTVAPSISGTPRDGAALTADGGEWSGTEPIDLAYQWRRCDATGAACSDIPGATERTYEAGDADVGATLRIAVTATNAGGSQPATSPPTAAVAPAPPVDVDPPSISGTARDGATLTAEPGAWTGTSPIAYAYQWQRCDADGAECAPIAGATERTITAGPTEVGRRLRVTVTASNAAGSTPAISPASERVAAARPANTAAPSIEGTPRDGETLTADEGMWTGTAPLTFTYQWRRCDADGAGCADIPGAGERTYEATGADVGATLRVVVTGSGAGGTESATSAAGDAVAPAVPVNDTPPTVAGTVRDGETLTAGPGVWHGTEPIAYTYRWQRCALNGACEDVAGRTGTTYAVGPADVGNGVRVVVTATNAAGSASTPSTTSTEVSAAPPANATEPTVSGDSRDGATLTADPGTWTGTDPISFAYRWQRCDSAGGACTDIAGADASNQTYTQTADDLARLRVVVTATNSGGSSSAPSAATAAVVPTLPADTAAPVVAGTPRDGETLTADPGTWSGTEPTTFAYRWQRCDAGGALCADIPGAGATERTYTATAADVGARVRVLVTATNAAGAVDAWSEATEAIAAAPPVETAAPAITGSPRDAVELTAERGTWRGTAPIEFAYRWQRCDASGAACAPIAGATAATYTPAGADVGTTLRVVVTATNAGGSQSATSPASDPVAAAPPSNTAAPAIDGTVADERTLTADPGTWTGTDPIDYAYGWQRCDAAGASCGPIAGATERTYEATDADVAGTLRVVVTATNAAGRATATSPATIAVSPAAPSNTALPEISGTPRVDEPLSASPGTWSGTGPFTYAYQWRRCDAAGGACQDIPGAAAASASYTPTAEDLGRELRVTVTATGPGGSQSATSAETTAVEAVPPAVGDAPSITGTPRDDGTLTADPGTWTGTQPIAFAYRWQRCDAAGAACEAIDGATERTYTPTDEDVGRRLRVVVTATNAGGADTATSPAAAAVAPSAPAATAAPTVSGTPQVGEPLTASTGTFSGTAPIGYTYAWERCDPAGASCAPIPGATAATYTPTAADQGATLRAIVTATNAQGSDSSPSPVTAPVAAPAAAGTPAPSTPPAAPSSPSSPSTPTTGAGGPSPGTSTGAAPAAPTAADLSALAGSAVAPSRCVALVGGGGLQRANLAATGAVRLRVRADGAVTAGAPVVVTLRARRVSGLRSVRYRLDGRRLRSSRGPDHRLVLSPAALRPGRHVLSAQLRLSTGAPRTLRRSLRVGTCASLFTARQDRTAGGTALRLRVDSRAAASNVTFTLPSAVARGLALGRPSGRLRIVTPSGARRYTLRPARGRSPARLVAGNGRPGVRVSGRTITVSALPASTGIVELTVYQPRPPRGAAPLARGRSLRATAVVRTTRGERLTARLRGVARR